jgi:hypothetical protein
MFEFRLRILDVRERETDAFSYLGIVEGFPGVLVHAGSASDAEQDLLGAVASLFERLQDPSSTRLELDNFPTVREVRLFLCPLGSS